MKKVKWYMWINPLFWILMIILALIILFETTLKEVAKFWEEE